jgi:hypothetical protein
MLWAGQATGSIPMLLVGSQTLAGADSAFVRSPALRAGCIAAFSTLLVYSFSKAVPPTRRCGPAFPLAWRFFPIWVLC